MTRLHDTVLVRVTRRFEAHVRGARQDTRTPPPDAGAGRPERAEGRRGLWRSCVTLEADRGAGGAGRQADGRAARAADGCPREAAWGDAHVRAFEKFVKGQTQLLALLRVTAERDQQMLTSMQKPS